MLYIIASKPFEGAKKEGEEYVKQWHIGQPLPKKLPLVVTFQADGDELTSILNALRLTGG